MKNEFSSNEAEDVIKRAALLHEQQLNNPHARTIPLQQILVSANEVGISSNGVDAALRDLQLSSRLLDYGEPKFTKDEERSILNRAVQLDIASSTFSVDALRKIAKEVGVPLDNVLQSLREAEYEKQRKKLRPAVAKHLARVVLRKLLWCAGGVVIYLASAVFLYPKRDWIFWIASFSMAIWLVRTLIFAITSVPRFGLRFEAWLEAEASIAAESALRWECKHCGSINTFNAKVCAFCPHSRFAG